MAGRYKKHFWVGALSRSSAPQQKWTRDPGCCRCSIGKASASVACHTTLHHVAQFDRRPVGLDGLRAGRRGVGRWSVLLLATLASGADGAQFYQIAFRYCRGAGIAIAFYAYPPVLGGGAAPRAGEDSQFLHA